MNVTLRTRLALAVLGGLALLVTACNDEDSPSSRTATSTGTATAGTETATGTVEGLSSATTQTSAEAVQAIAETNPPELSPLYVGNTGGSGVAVRSACQDEARAGGSWPMGAQVIVLWPGEGECEGWTHITGSHGPSWIRNDYLVSEAPAVPAGSGSVSGATAARAPQAPTATGSRPRPTAAAPAPTVPQATLQIPQPGGGVITNVSLDGVGILYGGQSGFDYLGLISSSRSGNSICNTSGPYGSATSPTSVRNPSGAFGRQDGGAVEPNFNSDFSPYVQSAENPPKITLNGETVGYLTRNVEKFGNRAVSPDTLFRALGCG